MLCDCPCMFFDSSLHHSGTPLLRDCDSPKRRHLGKAKMEVRHYGTTQDFPDWRW